MYELFRSELSTRDDGNGENGENALKSFSTFETVRSVTHSWHGNNIRFVFQRVPTVVVPQTSRVSNKRMRIRTSASDRVPGLILAR